MYFFAAKGIRNEKKESMEIPVANNRLTAYRTMITVSVQHAATCHFLEIHCKVVDYIFLCGKRNGNNKKYVYGNCIN